MRVYPLSEKPNPGGPFRFLLLCASVGVGIGFAVKYADVVTQAVLTGVQHLVKFLIAMMIAPGQGHASALAFASLLAALSAVSALAVGGVVVGVWYIYRRRAGYG